MLSNGYSAAVLALAASLVSAQTFTDCNPTQKSCPADPALGTTIAVDFTKGASSFFTGTKLDYDPNLGAIMKITSENDSPTLTSTKYIFYGKVEVELQASVGVGVITSLVLESDDLDEIDWEWLGGDFSKVQTNYFSKGDTSTYDRGSDVGIANPQTSFHTYTIDWTATTLTWSIDGQVKRVLNAADHQSGPDAYPQTPMKIKLGTWVAGSSKNAPGTVQWAGGMTDFSQAPFFGYYRKVTITDYSSGASQYEYSDRSGSSASIKITGGGGKNVTQGEAVSSSSSSSAAPKTTSTSSSSSSKSSSTTMSTVTSSNATTTTSKTGSVTAPTTTGTTSQTAAPNAAGKAVSSMSAVALVAVFLFGLVAL